MMIKKSLLLSIFFISFFSFSQQITVEDIWKSYKFLSKRVKGFRSMNDGVSYTKMAADQSIIKYSITNPKDTGVVLIKGSDLMMENKPILIDDYQFNKDETKILLLSNQKYRVLFQKTSYCQFLSILFLLTYRIFASHTKFF